MSTHTVITYSQKLTPDYGNVGLEPRPSRYASNSAMPTYILDSASTEKGVREWSANISGVHSPESPCSDMTLEGTESSLTKSVIEAPTKVTAPVGPRYLYYRVYSEDGAIPSKRPLNPNDACLGRIMAISVAPPHTTASLKRRLCSIENIGDDTYTNLFASTSSKSPMDDKGRVTLLSKTGPGLTQQEPMALVTKLSLSGRDLLDSVHDMLFCRPSPPESRYLYYRVYTEDGAISSKHAIDSCNPSLGRINVNFFPPPHTAAFLKRVLARAENIDNHTRTCLFMDTSSPVAMEDLDYVSILSDDGPGSIPREPLALVTESSNLLDTPVILSFLVDSSIYSEPRYLYYRVYTEYGEIPSKQPVDSDDPPLGRINAKFITPPHTVSSLKRCISTVESFTHPALSELFVNISSEVPLTDAYISILTCDGPGSSADEPMALVQPAVYTSFSKKVVALYGWVQEANNPQFLPLTEGEILYTDGLLRSEMRSGKLIQDQNRTKAVGSLNLPLCYFSGQVIATEGYQVLNAVGSLGFVMKDWLQFC